MKGVCKTDSVNYTRGGGGIRVGKLARMDPSAASGVRGYCFEITKLRRATRARRQDDIPTQPRSQAFISKPLVVSSAPSLVSHPIVRVPLFYPRTSNHAKRCHPYWSVCVIIPYLPPLDACVFCVTGAALVPGDNCCHSSL